MRFPQASHWKAGSRFLLPQPWKEAHPPGLPDFCVKKHSDTQRRRCTQSPSPRPDRNPGQALLPPRSTPTWHGGGRATGRLRGHGRHQAQANPGRVTGKRSGGFSSVIPSGCRKGSGKTRPKLPSGNSSPRLSQSPGLQRTPPGMWGSTKTHTSFRNSWQSPERRWLHRVGDLRGGLGGWAWISALVGGASAPLHMVSPRGRVWASSQHSSCVQGKGPTTRTRQKPQCP